MIDQNTKAADHVYGNELEAEVKSNYIPWRLEGNQDFIWDSPLTSLKT